MSTLSNIKEGLIKAHFKFLTAMLLGRELSEIEMIILYEVITRAQEEPHGIDITKLVSIIKDKYKDAKIPKTYPKIHAVVQSLVEEDISKNVGRLLELGLLTEKQAKEFSEGKITLMRKNDANKGHRKVLEATSIGRMLFDESIKYQKIIKEYIEVQRKQQKEKEGAK